MLGESIHLGDVDVRAPDGQFHELQQAAVSSDAHLARVVAEHALDDIAQFFGAAEFQFLARRELVFSD